MGVECAKESDLEALAVLMTRENQEPSRRCMHSGTTLESNLQSLRSLGVPLDTAALVHRSSVGLDAALVCDVEASEGKAYLLGPFTAGAEHWRAELLDEMLEGVTVARFFSHSHAKNRKNRQLYLSRGFVEGQGVGARLERHA